MKKTLTALFYLIAFGAIVYFLRYYLHAPREFIISLILSLAIIGILVRKKNSYLIAIGSSLLIIHIVWLIAIFIPVYEEQLDIRRWYRQNPSLLTQLPGATVETQVLLSNNKQLSFNSTELVANPLAIYQWDQISTRWAEIRSDAGVFLTFRDGSSAHLLPQTTIKIERLAPDYVSLTNSQIALSLDRGVITVSTMRKTFADEQRYVVANNSHFSCKQCTIALSGNAWSIASDEPFVRWTSWGEHIMLSGGNYSFDTNAIRKSDSTILQTLLTETKTTLLNRGETYTHRRQEFIRRERGRTMDASILLTTVSKRKMAIIGLIDRTYREKYNNLLLYEYLREGGELPTQFNEQKHLIEFVSF